MIETAKVSSKGQIVIPEKMRTYLGIKEGTRMVVRERGTQLILEKEEDFTEQLKVLDIDKEKLGLLVLSEKSLAKDWLSKEDEEAWSDL